MLKLWRSYINTFRGLSKETWYLCAVTFVNRAGTMVIPFLALYLTEKLDFSFAQVGWVMTAFGLGSLAGVWLGGKLTDKIGYYQVMAGSLFGSGILFILLQYFQTFWPFCIMVFVLMVVADAFRPAGLAAISAYSKPVNRTRSVTLNRLAINIGFSFGPAVGGLIIVKLGYQALFWIDGLTCLTAVAMVFLMLNPKKVKTEVPEVSADTTTAMSPLKDRPYLLFILMTFFIGFAFMQLFSTIPLYYKDSYGLSENIIGLIMAMNGMIIVLMEMPLVQYFETSRIRKLKIIQISCILIGASYLVLLTGHWMVVIYVGMLLVTFGEMLAFPFTNAFAMNRAPSARSGEYLALYGMSFSAAHIVGPNAGMQVAEHFGFEAVWLLMAAACVIAVLIAARLIKILPAGPQIVTRDS